jgi:hypothetical protein
MFASQLAWHPCKSVPWQAFDSQFPLQACWHIRMMEWHLRVTPMLVREGRCISPTEWWNGTFVVLQFISILPSLFLGMGFEIFFGECVFLISAKYQLFIFPSTLMLTLADHCCHPWACTFTTSSWASSWQT